MRAIVALVLAVLVCGCASAARTGDVEPEQRVVDAGPAVEVDAGQQEPDAGQPSDDAAPVATDPAEASAGDAGPDQGATAPDAGPPAPDAAPTVATVADASPPPAPPPPGVSLTWENQCEPNGETLQIEGVVQNTGTATVNAADVTVRYWFSCVSADYGHPCANLSAFDVGNHAVGSSAVVKALSPRTEHADSYVEISYAAQDIVPGALLAVGSFLPSGASVVSIYGHDPIDDWSFQSCIGDFGLFAPWNHVTVYVAGYLVWGVEPTATTDPVTP